MKLKRISPFSATTVIVVSDAPMHDILRHAPLTPKETLVVDQSQLRNTQVIQVTEFVCMQYLGHGWALRALPDTNSERHLKRAVLSLKIGANLLQAAEYGALHLGTEDDARNLRKHLKATTKALKLKRKLDLLL